MNAKQTTKRLPRSVRKHLRNRKAVLRRELPVKEAKQAIEQLVRGFRRKT